MENDLTVNKSVGGITFNSAAHGGLDESEIPEDDYEKHYVFPADSKETSSFPIVDAEGNLRSDNVEIAFRSRGDAPDEDTLLSVLRNVNDEFDEPPIDSDDLEDAMSENSSSFMSDIKSFLGRGDAEQSVNESAESDSDTSLDMGDKTELLVNEHGFDVENLPDEDTQCFDRIYNAVTDEENDSTETDLDVNDVVEETLDEAEDRFATTDDVEEIVTNALDQRTEREQKQDLADTIIQNSDDWEDDDREDLMANDTNVLESLAANVEDDSGTADRRGELGASAHGGNDDASSWAAPSANARLQELEGDD
jgi:hypothetical protein